jgi:lipopolysaccharide export system permease protein
MSEEPVAMLLHPPDGLSMVDHERWIAEAHKRLSTPIAALTYALIALLSVLTGEFQRHASVLRPLAAVGGVVSLVALNLAFQSLGARDNTLLLLLWAQSVLPPLALAAVLFGPQVASVSLRTRPGVLPPSLPPSTV